MGSARQLVTSSELESYFVGTRRDAQADLPLLIRRLLFETCPPGSLSRLRMPAGDDVRLNGWDGYLTSTQSHPFVPEGSSAWEMGVGADPATKATADFKKRSANPGEVDPRDATFVFVTPHVWEGRDAWVEARREESPWREIRGLDGADLSAWLDLAPATAAWFHARRGTPIDGIEDMESAWFRLIEEPLNRAVPHELVLGGRGDAANAVAEWLGRPEGDLTIRTDSAEEAVAFVIAVSETGRRTSELLPPVLVARKESAIHYLGGLTVPHIVLVADPSVVSELRAARLPNVQLVIPARRRPGGRQAEGVELGPLDREPVESTLRQMGFPPEGAARVARESLGSLAAVLWGLESRALDELPWLEVSAAHELAPLVLARHWPAHEHADHKVIESLAERPMQDVRRTAATWSDSGGPLELWGDMWDWKAWRVAWRCLAHAFTPDLLDRFRDIALKVLSTRDPAACSDDDEGLFDRGNCHPNTKALRKGLVDSLAMFGSLSRDLPDLSGQSLADVVVRQLLEGEGHPQRWRSLAPWLEGLAEASPDQFLRAAESIPGNPELVAGLFADRGMFSTSPHTHLLWALERLAWNPQYLARVLVLLGRLAEVDPGGQTANRPGASITEILLPWWPGTSAGPAQRLAAFGQLAARCPEVAWERGLSLLPSDRMMAIPTAKPRFRAWPVREAGPATPADQQEVLERLLEQLVVMAADNPRRWADLFHALPDLVRAAPLSAEQVTAAFGHIHPADWPATDRRLAWEELRDTVARHRGCPDADWALDPQQLEGFEKLMHRVESQRPQDLHHWLFERHPRVHLEGEFDWRKEQAALGKARMDEVNEVLRGEGLPAILDWGTTVGAPDVLGGVLAGADLTESQAGGLLDETLLASSGADDDPRRRLGAGFVSARARDRGVEWALRQAREAYRTGNRDGASRVLLALPPSAEVWDAVDEWDERQITAYWERGWVQGLEIAEAERAVPHLLRANQHYAAIELVGHFTERPQHRATSEPNEAATPDRVTPLVRMVMAEIPKHSPKDEVRGFDPGWLVHAIGELLDHLDEHCPDDGDVADLVQRWEWCWLEALDRTDRGPKALRRALATTPRLFVELLSLVFRRESDQEEPDPREGDGPQPEEGTVRVATQAFHLLQEWNIVPGLDTRSARFLDSRTADEPLLPATPAVEGRVDPGMLRAWIDEARSLAREADQLGMCDQHIGQVLAFAPADEDGSWPCQPVRDQIEALANDDVEIGFRIATSNRRGGHWVGRTGAAERRINAAFEQLAAKIEPGSPRTAAVLRALANTYDWEAKQVDEFGRRRQFDDR